MKAAQALNWARFFAQLLPILSDLARELFVRHRGDASAAEGELKEIRDHRARRREAEQRIDRELAEDAAARTAKKDA